MLELVRVGVACSLVSRVRGRRCLSVIGLFLSVGVVAWFFVC